MANSESTNIFDVAKSVNDHLSKLPKEDQVKVLRWVAESLGVSVGSPSIPTPNSSGHESTAQTPAPTESSQTNQEGFSGTTDIKTFVEEKQPNSDNQFAAVVAYYYRFKAPEADQSETITAEALQNAARLSRRHVPSQPSVTLNNAEKQGYLDRIDRGHFRINTVGENLVAMTLPSGNGADSSGPSSRRPRSRKSSGKKASSKKSGGKTSRKTRKKQ